MKEKNLLFKIVDIFLLVLMILPIVCGIALKVVLIPAADGIEIRGAHIFTTLHLPFFDLPITESQVNSWLVILSVMFMCIYLTHGIRKNVKTRRQLVAEFLIEKTENLVEENMGDYFLGFAPFVAAILALSAFSSLLTLVGLYPPTSDINIVAGWAILVFFLITYYKMKCGPLSYLKSFFEPVPLLAPLNIVGEVATPISMAFRHYGNVLSGSIISVLMAALLQNISHALLSWLPGWLGQFPLFQIGLPAVLSVYFDVFSGCLQAFIFAMLTMLYVSSAFSIDEYFAKKKRKQEKRSAKQN